LRANCCSSGGGVIQACASTVAKFIIFIFIITTLITSVYRFVPGKKLTRSTNPSGHSLSPLTGLMITNSLYPNILSNGCLLSIFALSTAFCQIALMSCFSFPMHVKSPLSYCRLWRPVMGHRGMCPPPRLPTISFLVHFGVNLRANYIQVLCSLRDQLVQMSTTHSSFDPYCISHKTSHQSAAAPGPEIYREFPMT